MQRRRDVIGREQDLASLEELVQHAPLVTVHGVGGCGKTTLVREFLRGPDAQPHVFVPLAPVRTDAGVEAALASALGLQPTGPATRPLDAAVAALSKTSGILVVDNCEHVADAVRMVLATILDACEGWSLVATSRVVLGLPHEHVLALAPLAVPLEVPNDLDDLLCVPSVQLFEARARQRVTSFAVANTNAAAVARICRRLDGLPLAIELAAAWVPVLSVSNIAEQLTDGDLLAVSSAARVVDDRHQTLDECIAWSLGLLADEELALLRRLAVFDGPIELTTAAALSAADARSLLANLVAASLVVVDESTGRFTLLQTVRDAVRRHAGPECEVTLRADHLRAVCGLARRLGGRTISVHDAHEAATAATWAASAGLVDEALELVGLLADLWWWRPDGKSILDLVLAVPGGSARRRADALLARALVAITTVDYGTALADCREALDLAMQLGDTTLEGRARGWLGWALSQIDPQAAREQLEAARRLLDGAADVRALGNAICGLAALAASEGDPLTARQHLDDMTARVVLADAGSGDALAYALAWSALVRLQQGQLELARSEADEAKRRARALGSGLYTLLGLTWSARASLGLGDIDAARACVEEADELIASGWSGLNPFVDLLRGEVALAEGDWERAIDLLGPSVPLACRATPVLGAVLLARLAEAFAGAARMEDAQRALADAASALGDGHRPWGRASVALVAARIALGAGDAGGAYREALEALTHATAIDDAVTAAAALDVLAASCARQAQIERSERFAAIATGVRAAHGLRGAPERAEHPVSLADALAFARRGRGSRLRPSHGWASLTPTEREVVALVADGLTNREIAARLFVARSTVKDHLAKVFRKLDVSTRAELSALATRNRLTSRPS